MELFEQDKAATLRNRARLRANRNLLMWYRELFRAQFAGIDGLEEKKILEIGSGTSPMTVFYDNVATSDLLDLDHLDHHFDCHEIHRYDPIPDGSVDVITMTNVLHHLADPLKFLVNASCKLRPGGLVVMTEPYYSALSKPIYKYLHHEPSDFSIDKPLLPGVRGPLSSSNMAIPYLLFFGRPDWNTPLHAHYEFNEKSVSFFSSLSYMATGGISRKLPFPHSLYKPFFMIDRYLARKFPRLLCSFFIMRLRKREADHGDAQRDNLR